MQWQDLTNDNVCYKQCPELALTVQRGNMYMSKDSGTAPDPTIFSV
jgi:hypothetical protein